jgi:hypothetical protein
VTTAENLLMHPTSQKEDSRQSAFLTLAGAVVTPAEFHCSLSRCIMSIKIPVGNRQGSDTHAAEPRA